MSENESKSFALVPKAPSAVERSEPGARRILAGMVADALALANTKPVAPAAAKFRIGDYEWCEPDYRQILVWAQALAIKPEEVTARLQQGRRLSQDFWGETLFHEGRLLKINWDFDLLPLQDFEWDEQLSTTHLSFYPGSTEWPAHRKFRIALAELSHLACSKLGLVQLEIAKPTRLMCLVCAENRLIELDLSNVPNLVTLNCWGNQIVGLDLSNVPNLEGLSCGRNGLSHLNLSSVSKLKELHCRENEITELDLSKIPHLEKLDLLYNPIRFLDAGPMRDLTWILVPKHTELCWPKMVDSASLRVSAL